MSRRATKPEAARSISDSDGQRQHCWVAPGMTYGVNPDGVRVSIWSGFTSRLPDAPAWQHVAIGVKHPGAIYVGWLRAPWRNADE